jgi:hypothetical protein
MAKEKKGDFEDRKGMPAPKEENAGSGDQIRSEKSAFLAEGKFFVIQAIPGIGDALGNEVETLEHIEGQFTESVRLPGIARVRYVPTFGVASKLSDPMNQAAQSMYNKVQDKMNNRNLPFQGIDLLKTIIAIDSIHQLYRIIYRAYRTLGAADLSNNYLPQALFTAYGFNFASFRNNKAQIREDLAYWRDMLNNRYPCPRVFKLMELHEQMTKFIYADSNSKKAQMYVCTPAQLLSWQNNDTTGQLSLVGLINEGAILENVPVSTLEYPTVRTYMNNMLDAMFDSTDFQRIMAAIKTTWEGDVIELPDPTSDDVINFVYDEGFINCLQNATVYPLAYPTVVPTWVNNTNVITTAPQVRSTLLERMYEPPQLLNATHDMPTASEMTNYMRWRISVDPQTEFLESCATEVVTGIDVFTEINDNDHPFIVGYARDEAGGPDTENRKPLLSSFTIFTLPKRDNSGAVNLPSEYLLAASVLDAFDATPMYYAHFKRLNPEDETESWNANVPMVHWKFMARVSKADVRSYHKALLWAAFLE